MEKIRHDSSYEWLSGESWKEWSASFFSMGWKHFLPSLCRPLY